MGAWRLVEFMLTERKPEPSDRSKEGARQPTPRPPGWADGLRKLYDGVVNEPLPDSFDDLLKKLDQPDNG